MNIAIKDALIVTYVDDALVQKRASIFIEDETIARVGDPEGGQRTSRADVTINGESLIAIPGLVNLHSHAGPTAIRGLAEDLRLSEWLERYVNPAHAHLTREDAETDYRLSYLEMLKSGITHVLDLYRFVDEGVRVANELGIRATLAPYASDVYDSFERPEDMVKAVETYSSGNGLARVWAGFEHISYCTEACLEEVSRISRELHTGIHTHEFETLEFVEMVVKAYGRRPLHVLRQFGLLNGSLVLAHCVWPTPEELRTIAESGVKCAHNPTSNMKLASGVAPVPEMLRLGITVGLGTDGVKENNRLDLFQEMKYASLMQRVTGLDASLLPAPQVFRMATVMGNKALGMKAGQIREGYLADIVLLDASAPNLNPLYLDNVVSAVVFSAHPGNVKHVIVNGELVVRDGKHVKVNEDEVVRKAVVRGRQLLDRMRKDPT
ncbi:MAG: amidohydrolase family protein [Nitrososphaeria archaeon]